MNENHDAAKNGYNRFLLLVAGLGGLLYGVDVGIIAGALPYLEATSSLSAGQLSFVVAAVLLGSVISTLFAGLLSDWMGRKKMMSLSGILFVISIPMIALAHGYWPLVSGRLLQGISAGLIGVVVPLYLAECLGAANRGKGTGIFQWLLTLGIVVAAFIGLYFSHRVDEVAQLGDPEKLFAAKEYRLAQHLLGFVATRRFVCDRQLHGVRITALAVPARPKGRRTRRAASFALGGADQN